MSGESTSIGHTNLDFFCKASGGGQPMRFVPGALEIPHCHFGLGISRARTNYYTRTQPEAGTSIEVSWHAAEEHTR